MNNTKLTVHNLQMEYEEGAILKNISFKVYEGEFLTILGPSGCGKSTLLRLLIGLARPVDGQIVKDTVEITNSHPSKRRMGIVFQNYALFEHMTVLENVEYALMIQKENKMAEKKKIVREKVMEMLRCVNMEGQINKYPAQLSGGEQQRVAIARTLVMNPDIILLDEPLSALDAATRISMRKLLNNIQKDYGTTMIYVTHDQEEAFAMADRIMIMNDGKIMQIDTPENIMKNPSNQFVREFVIENIQIKIDSLIPFIREKNEYI